MRKQLLKNNLLLQFIVIILGFTAILGKLISVSAYELVWYRTMIAILALVFIILLRKHSFRLPIKDIGKLAAIGIVIAVHWICFFHAIKVSNVSVTLGCLSVTTLFTSFIEPLVSRKRISLFEVIVGLVIILGVYIIFSFETRYLAGILFALLAALLASVFSVLNKQIASNYEPEVTTFYEMLSGFLAISLFFLFSGEFSRGSFALTSVDILCLLALGIICTAYAFSATVRLMQKLSAYQIVLAINLEPVYGILAAYFIFGESEHMSPGFYVGASIILVSVVVYTVVKSRTRKGVIEHIG